MTEDACRLDKVQRELVESTIARHCEIRHWELHAVNCRSNHVHVVVSANLSPKEIQRQFKMWCTMRLKESLRAARIPEEQIRENWWAERGSRRWINHETSLEAAVVYVKDGQDRR